MRTIPRFQRVMLGTAAVLALVVSSPLAVTAEDQVLAAAPVGPSWDDMSGYGAVEANRATVSALLVPDPTWDQTSGYGAVEANRAAASVVLPPTSTTMQVPGDVRWAPESAITPRPSVEASGVTAAKVWDKTSGYGAVEASRAVR